ncbi:MAG: DUF2135 domain-containing protein [Holophagaceae bacterium]|nr:DUF2135 domain-containing protein [Holophagaceae bacterium]
MLMRGLLASSFLAFAMLVPHQNPASQRKSPTQAQARQVTTAPPTRPAIYIPSEDGRKTPAQIQALKIDVQVVGALATTTWDMTIYNPQARLLEGELVFPLGEGQTVSRFAMDVNGVLREGVVVEKAKGRQVFESIVRRGVDPGLLEMVAGNSFKARIYPIPARGTKRVVIAYEQELPFVAKKDGDALSYTLPMGFDQPIGRFTLNVEVLEQTEQPRFTSSPLQNFELKPWQRSFKAEATREHFKPDSALTLLVPKSAEASGSFAQRFNDERYFYLSLMPRAPREPRPSPKKLLIAWDASASAANRDLSKEMELLDRYFKRIGSCSVALVIFRNEPESPLAFAVKNGDWKALREAIESAPADGGTAFGALDLSGVKCDEALLFSDGINTFGPAAPTLPNCPVLTINTALTAQHDRLRFLAESTGGEYLNLSAETAEQGAESLKTRALAFLRATYEPGAVQELYPSAGALVRGSFGIAGKLSKERARITLHFGYGKDERFSRVVTVGGDDSTTAPVARLWAQKKLQQLMLEPELNRPSILQLGETFSIVTPNTSLIVLDALSDYVRYHIVPPADMQTDYFRQVQDEDRGKKEAEQRHLESLLSQFKERQNWWETEFKPLPKVQKTRDMKDAQGTERGVIGGMAGGVVGGVVNAPPPPSPQEQPAARRAEPPRPVASPSMQVDIAESRSGANISADRLSEVSKSKKENRKPDAEPETKGTITLKPWNPDTPYLKALSGTPKADRYAAYLKLRAEYGSTPGFFLDVSDLFYRDGDGNLALRILSNIAELKLEDATLLRVLGYRLKQLGQHRLSVWASEEVLRMREEEPQSSRDLALACAADGQEQRAADLLWNVVRKPWDGRFRDVNLIALGELNAVIGTAKSKINTINMDSRFIRNLPVDVRVVLNWDTDNSDMDLHVIDPQGEECFYSHARTLLGGRISADVTGGYGPEEFLLKKAIPGTYKVRANYFGTRQQSVIGATTVSLELYLHYASGKVENKSVILRLTGNSRLVDVGEFVFVK